MTNYLEIDCSVAECKILDVSIPFEDICSSLKKYDSLQKQINIYEFLKYVSY
jgi:hypothetical protein